MYFLRDNLQIMCYNSFRKTVKGEPKWKTGQESEKDTAFTAECRELALDM